MSVRTPLSSTFALACMAVLASCGGEDSSTATPVVTVTPTPTTTTSPTPTPTTGTTSTASVLCPTNGTYTGDYSAAGTLTSNWSWTCSTTARTLMANGLPNHAVGTFPNAGNQNTITTQTINFSATLSPVLGTSTVQIGGPGGASAFSLQGVKFDPGTGGACATGITATSQCDLGGGTGAWRIEALGQDTFDFGEDSNNAHVQPGGIYHYHGMPEGLLTNAGVSDAAPKMTLVGWAGDGFPIYARWCYSTASDATSALKKCTGSFVRDTVADANRPAISLVPLGAFLSDWSYSAGSGDLDECNGRTGVTPEFPNGIYHYMATDSYPYFSRCLKGQIS